MALAQQAANSATPEERETAAQECRQDGAVLDHFGPQVPMKNEDNEGFRPSIYGF